MAEDQPAKESIEQLVARLEHLERVAQLNTARLHAVERRLSIEPPPMPRKEEPTDGRAREGRAQEVHGHAEPQAPAADARGNVGAQADAGAASPAASAEAPPAPTTNPFQKEPGFSVFGKRRGGAGEGARDEGRGRDLESVIGGRAFAWVGILAVAFASAFFLKHAFDSGYIGPTTRVVLGAAVGLALLGVGELLRAKGLRHYAFVISGGGILVLYLSIYAAYNFYQLLVQPLAFVLMAGVTAAAVLLSVRLDALPVAVLGLIGGFLTPPLLSTGQDNQVALFTYVALLDAGVLALGYFKNWRSLDILSFFATVLTTLGWAAIHYSDEKLWTTIFFVSLLFVLYSLLAVAHNLLPRRAARWYDLLLVSGNATFYFGLSYVLLTGAGYGSAPASQALLVSAFYAGLFYAAWRLNRADRLLTYGFVGAAVTFFTVAVGIRLELHWVTMAWAVEGLMLTWAGLRAREDAARRAALAVFGVAVVHWLVFDMPGFSFGQDASFVPLLNRRALSCAVLVGALAAASWLQRRGEGRDEGERAGASTLYALLAHGLALTLLTQDLSDYFQRRLVAGEGPDSGTLYERTEVARQFSLTALWTIYGATLVAYGARRGASWARLVGLLLLVLATIKCVARDLAFYDAPWHAPVFNHTFMGFALLVAGYAVAAHFYARAARLGEEERPVVPALVAVANVLAVVALSAEASGYFAARIREGGHTDAALRDLSLARQLSLSVIWALYGGALLIAGRARGARLLRLLALALLGLTTVKVFFWDLASLDRVYRIVSFVVLGLILLAVSYLYQKSQQRAETE